MFFVWFNFIRYQTFVVSVFMLFNSCLPNWSNLNIIAQKHLHKNDAIKMTETSNKFLNDIRYPKHVVCNYCFSTDILICYQVISRECVTGNSNTHYIFVVNFFRARATKCHVFIKVVIVIGSPLTRHKLCNKFSSLCEL